jgi:hypothetical protein
MLNPNEIIKSINTNPNSTTAIEPSSGELIIAVVDRSGSTASRFNTTSTVLAKELSVLRTAVLSNPKDKWTMYSFDNVSNYHGPIKVLHSENLVDLPVLKPGGSTDTAIPLNDIIKAFSVSKPNRVIIITDGETNSKATEFYPIITAFNKNNVKLEVIAVTNSDLNMETLSLAEEKNIPGMDLVNMIGNSIHRLSIYSRVHIDTPYIGAHSSKINKNALTFMEVPFKGLIPEHIIKVIDEMEKNKDNIDWGDNQITLKKFISEIGKLLSIMFINFPENHSFITNTVKKISGFSGFTDERVFNIMKYGFECTKSEKPIIYTNFEQHIKDSVVKKAEFADATILLSSKGTTGGCSKRICLPLNGVCILDNGFLTLKTPLNKYPYSVDGHNNVYFSTEMNPQATRIAFRELCNSLRFPNARNSPSVIFFVANYMSLMYISGVSKDTEHMKELQQLAIYQTSMEVLVANGKYDGVGCFKNWQSGILIPMNYSNPNTHTTLYKDSNINPLKLTEPIWWALMMSMLGIFKEQLSTYESPIKAICGDDVTEEKFLEYIRNEYKKDVKGEINLIKLEEPKTSVFTLDCFESTDSLFKLRNHGPCKAETWYSASEKEHVKKNGCVWCRAAVSDDMFEPVTIVDNNKKIVDAMTVSTPLIAGTPNTSSIVSQIDSTVNNCLRINMLGITGSGKSTASEIMANYFNQSGWNTLVVSADKWSKKGIKGKAMANCAKNEIEAFESNGGNLAIIVDICHDNGINDKCIGYDLSKYRSYTFVPNFEKSTDNFGDYESWCLLNVLSRAADTPDSNYWLNPVSAGVKTCIDVHNKKASGIKKVLGVAGALQNFNSSLSIDAIKSIIEPKAASHASKLASRDMMGIISEFLDKICK